VCHAVVQADAARVYLWAHCQLLHVAGGGRVGTGAEGQHTSISTAVSAHVWCARTRRVCWCFKAEWQTAIAHAQQMLAHIFWPRSCIGTCCNRVKPESHGRDALSLTSMVQGRTSSRVQPEQ
jgi:hypothetical protein